LLVDFVLQLERPRKEFVGLSMVPLPENSYEFETCLEKAAGCQGYIEYLQRTNTEPGRMMILVQRGKSKVSRLQVSFSERVHIHSWIVGPDSPLYAVYLEWRYLRTGSIAGYFAKRDRAPKWDRVENVEKALFRENPIGAPSEEDVMQKMKSVVMRPVDGTEEVLDRIRERGSTRA
jgi:hypothetical protein